MTTQKRKNSVTPPTGDFLLYQTEDGKTKIDVRMLNENRLAYAKADGGAVS